MSKRWVGVAAAFVTLCMASQSLAAELVVNASDRGWLNSLGQNNGHSASGNYLAGYCDPISCTASGEYRNFFTFTLPQFSDPLVSAVLRINTRSVIAEQSSAIDYQVTSTGAQNFAALGTGTVFGQRSYSVSDLFQIRDIDLTLAALTAIASAAGSNLTISGRVLPPTIFSGNFDSLVFGDSSAGSVQLILTTGQPVPEPATWAMMVLGFGAAGAVLRRQRAIAEL